MIDFAYKELVWGGQFPEIFFMGADREFCCSIHSNSKWCRGLGRRLGWVEGPVEIIEALEAVQGSSILCPDSLHQMALADYVKKGIETGSIKPYVAATAKLYEAAAKRTVQAINEYLKLPCLVPQGGLYTVVRTGQESSGVHAAHPGKNRRHFCSRLGLRQIAGKRRPPFLRPAGSSSRQD